MLDARARFAGVELYFDDLPGATAFYRERVGLALEEHVPDHHAKFALGSAFVCAERRGVEDYPSADKAVVFIEVPNLPVVLAGLGGGDVVGSGHGWAAIRDPEGHTVMLVQGGTRR